MAIWNKWFGKKKPEGQKPEKPPGERFTIIPGDDMKKLRAQWAAEKAAKQSSAGTRSGGVQNLPPLRGQMQSAAERGAIEQSEANRTGRSVGSHLPQAPKPAAKRNPHERLPGAGNTRMDLTSPKHRRPQADQTQRMPGRRRNKGPGGGTTP